MEESMILNSLLFFITFVFCFKFLIRSKISDKNLPPSPPSIPFLGHVHLIKQPIHRLYHRLSQKYGPIISLRFGIRRVVVVSSSTAAEECFTKLDIVLANRPYVLVGKYLCYNYSTMVAAPYGDHWRNLRRIGAIELFSSSRLNAFQGIRQDEVKQLLMRLQSSSSSTDDNRAGFTKVQLKSMFIDLALNNIMRMVAGKRYHGGGTDNEREAKEFRELMEEAFAVGGVSHPVDFFPILNWIGGRNFVTKVKDIGERMDRFMQSLIDDIRGKTQSGATTVVHHLLSLQQAEPHYYSDQIIKGLIQVMLFAGTDTAAITLEWAMSNLLNNPHVLNKARAEIDSEIGQHNLLNEADIPKLPYLRGIVLETLRLYPPGPLLVPHMASADCKISGYDVPRDTVVIFNAWAIHRDPELWDDPTSFKPERFENGEEESNKMMPFGLGRRVCPGAGLAQRIVGLTLGSLIQCFEWERVSEEEVDMAEGGGTTMPKIVPLEAMCKPRPIANKLLVGTV
ncbi:cytochrome P450, family 81, subfamily D, polypeptide 8 [Hibiscus trionum]|uniref:Cytochrome P450, family 81, subfamily D, polypeptide 8 n=1 Tax=Hibiscus trionum TaxID=183268 RepID=A0A9W7J3E8_HIBTR|nr:cytochrome P450, family 81, subfamily D, polypeptide 8 [Hibiscus trionum]